MKPQFVRPVRIVLWLCGIGLCAWLVWRNVYAFVGTDLLAVPAVVAFALAALLAGPPYKVRPPHRWAWRVRGVPRETRKKMKRFGRIIFWRIVKIKLPGKRFALFRSLALFAACLAFIGALSLPYARRKIAEGVPADLTALVAYSPPVTTQVYSADNELVCTFTLENRVRVPLDRIPQHVRQAFIAAEDKSFYTHKGIDPIAIIRAASVNFESGDTKQGASTLTQQAIKQVILKNNEKTYRRKLQEIVLAVEIEKTMPKDKILEVYLNHVFLGHGAYGIQAAAQTYFAKDVSQLTIAEAALLAGLPRAPSRDSPYSHYDRARARQAYVLGRMVETGAITQAQADEARAQEIVMIYHEDPLNRTAAPYFCDHVRRELKRMYGNEAIFEKGLTVHTTLDMRMQRSAESAVRRGLIDLERRIGWNGPEGKDPKFAGCKGPAEPVVDGAIEMARVTAVGKDFAVCVRGTAFPLHPDDAARVAKWEANAKKQVAVGDMMSVQIATLETVGAPKGKTPNLTRYALAARRTSGPDHPEALQSALVAVDPNTGELKALVGGYDFTESQYNAATMAHRQPGSSIKPYIYLTGLMHGMTVDETVLDGPSCYPSASGIWCPQNYRGPNTVQQYFGMVNLRFALAQSLNSVSVRLAHKYGIEEVIRTMRALGITSPLERVLPLAVGSAEITPWEHTYAYATIASGGKQMPRHPGAEQAGVFLRRVLDADGKELYRYDPVPREQLPQAVPAADAYALTYLMKGVVEQGTGRRVRELQRPAGGKTGTTNDFYDTWFMGFTTDLVVGVWVGRMTPQPIVKEATGGGVALPIWLAFVKAAHPETPAREFPVPADVTLVRTPWGELMPYQRGRMPQRLMVGTMPTGNFDDKSPF